MKKYIKEINNNLIVETKIADNNKTIISIYENGNKKILSELNTNDYFWGYVVNDENYIVVYSRGCMINQIPLNIEAAYNIKEQQLVELSDKNKTLLENMLISKKSFNISTILSYLNIDELEITHKNEIIDFVSYITSGNSKINRESIIEYILNEYPELENYMYLDEPIYTIEYNKLNNQVLHFHAMPQIINSNNDEKIKLKTKKYKRLKVKIKK